MKHITTLFILAVLIVPTINARAQSQMSSLDSANLRLKQSMDELDNLFKTRSSTSNGANSTGTQVKMGDKKDGGVVYWVDASGMHGLIAYPKDLGIMKWAEAMEACKKLGDGWHLATKDELFKLYQARHLDIVSSYFKFQSSTEADPGYAWKQSMSSGEQSVGAKPVRLLLLLFGRFRGRYPV
jgi:hypothetical protein